MGVAHLKRWHWILISLVVGAAVGFVQSSLGPEGFTFSGKHNSVGQAEFERAFARGPVNGKPAVKNVRVYPDGKRYLVTCSILQRSDDPKNPSKNSYEDFVLTTDVPYEPVADLTQTVNVGIHPAVSRGLLRTPGIVKVNMWPRPAPAQFSGWTRVDDGSADPGTDGQVKLALRPAKYQVVITAPAAQIAHLRFKLNDRALAPPQLGDSGLWQTTIPAEAFVKADQQVLHIARGDKPVAVREIRLVDPTYTVVDYLHEVSASHPQAAYRVGWWTQPKNAYSFWILSSLLLIGGVWPTLVHAISGPPPGSEKQEKEPAQYGAEPAADEPAKPRPVVSIDDELEGILAQSASVAAGSGAATAPPRAIPKLSDTPLQPTVPVNGSIPVDEKDFEGAYYPVRRGKHEGFTLVELLVVIGIIALLLALLMPSLARARQEAQRVQCMSNMKQVGDSLLMYANAWKGVMFPPGLGDSQPQSNRWPVFVFQPAVYNPPVMTCPSDQEPMYEHSYILNNHLTDHHVVYSDTKVPGVSPSEVIVMGEKVTLQPDYYMDAIAGDYTTKVDFYKHGAQRGSNYLYLDLHVETDMPTVSLTDIDPWDPNGVPTAPITQTE